jgi:hypothetical protein
MKASSPAELAQSGAAALNNEQLLQVGATPEGQQRLRGMAANLVRAPGPMTLDRMTQLYRLSSATFAPAGGLTVKGDPEMTGAYLTATRRTMLDSPSFGKLMNGINGDAPHPVTVNLQRNGEARMDSFADQTLDLSDLEKLPLRPRPERPDEVTQGAVLAHMMREQREKALQPEGPLGTKDSRPRTPRRSARRMRTAPTSARRACASRRPRTRAAIPRVVASPSIWTAITTRSSASTPPATSTEPGATTGPSGGLSRR